MLQRVLLVHSDETVRELATRALARIGVDVDVVARGRDAVTALDTRHYSVVVIDRDLCDHFIEAIGDRPVRPIVICTAAMGKHGGLDPRVVSLLIPAPYDAHTLVGVILACVTEGPPPPMETADSAISLG